MCFLLQFSQIINILLDVFFCIDAYHVFIAIYIIIALSPSPSMNTLVHIQHILHKTFCCFFLLCQNSFLPTWTLLVWLNSCDFFFFPL